MNPVESLLTFEKSKSNKPWKVFTLPKAETSEIILAAYGYYMLIFLGGEGFKEIVLVYTGSSGVTTYQEIIGGTNYTFDNTTPFTFKVSFTGNINRPCFVFTLSDTAEAYMNET